MPDGEGTRHYAANDVIHTGRFQAGEPSGPGEQREMLSGIVRTGFFAGAVLDGEGEERLPGGSGGRMLPSQRIAAADALCARANRAREASALATLTPCELTDRLVAIGETAEHYTGELRRGVRHGHGRLERAPGAMWLGEWTSAWEGQFADGVPEGQCDHFVEKSPDGRQVMRARRPHRAGLRLPKPHTQLRLC